MRARPRRGALGLRGRIVGAVLVTTVATLGVAALTLLGPLESSLKNADQKTLRTDIGPHKADVVGAFRRLSVTTPTGATLDLSDLSYTVVPRQDGAYGLPVHPVQIEVGKLEGTISARIGGSVYLLGYPDARGQGRIQAPRNGDVVGGSFDDATRAFLTRSRTGIYSFGSSGGTEYARAALWFEKGGVQWVLAIRKPIPEIAAAVSAVGTAFLYAALAGLGLTLILAIPLAATLVRRLRELRTAALQLAARWAGRGARRSRARRGRGPRADVRHHAAPAPSAGGGAAGVRRHGLSRAADAVDEPRRDARAAQRRPARPAP